MPLSRVRAWIVFLYLASFYGEPSDAAISPDEQWCVVVGRGRLVAHRVKSPCWDPMPTSGEQPRAWSHGGDTEDGIRFSHVRAAMGETAALERVADAHRS